MTPELQAQLAAYLKALLDTTQKAGTFAADQLPLIVQEKILYGRVVETFQLVLFAALVFGFYRMCRWGATKLSTEHGFEEGYFAATCVGGLGGVLFVIFTCIQVTYVASVWFAPRLYIIEWVAQLAKSK